MGKQHFTANCSAIELHVYKRINKLYYHFAAILSFYLHADVVVRNQIFYRSPNPVLKMASLGSSVEINYFCGLYIVI